ncbi:hypothetical protein L484_004885 [Morus notabilis]|uniref:Uncharacterized protein n=1 Tax=Morus notabilis TaxID=981085 RepID=W9S314_9ROSA|nr:hypothetical protein L484_004885 [Morus notabilis]
MEVGGGTTRNNSGNPFHGQQLPSRAAATVAPSTVVAQQRFCLSNFSPLRSDFDGIILGVLVGVNENGGDYGLRKNEGRLSGFWRTLILSPLLRLVRNVSVDGNVTV